MSRRGLERCKKRIFSLTATVLLLMSAFFVGVVIHVPTTEAGSVQMIIGNLDLDQLTDYGRISRGFGVDVTAVSQGLPQDARDPIQTLGCMGLVVDQGAYDHTDPMNIADPYFGTFPYLLTADFKDVTAISLVEDQDPLQKSFASFMNTASDTGDPNDILINQTTWAVKGKDWIILQWALFNVKGAPINNIYVGLEITPSYTGANWGLDTDAGDEIDGYDAVNGTYWVQDAGSGLTMGYGPGIAGEPITHYYSVDYGGTYTWVEYTALFGNNNNDTWLYNRLHAANGVEGLTPGNRSANIGWENFDLGIGESKTLTMVVALNNTYESTMNAIKDAQYYYHHNATGYLLTEFSDDSGTQRIELFNRGRPDTDLDAMGFNISLDEGNSFIPGTWNPQTVPTYGYSIFEPTGTPIVEEGGTISLYQFIDGSHVLIDGPLAYGQNGTVPDPLDGESVARKFDTIAIAYTDEWVRNASGGPTWGAENNVGRVFMAPPVAINRVLFDPIAPEEYYVELFFRGGGTFDISGYKIVCDDAYIVPDGTTFDVPNNRKYFVLNYSKSPGFFVPNMDAAGDNVYLYNSNGDLLDMVGWSSAHTQGYYMARVTDGIGMYNGFNNATSIAAGWVFDQMPTMLITEFSPDTEQIEVFNPRGGDKLPNVGGSTWKLKVEGGDLIGNWNPDPIPSGNYSVFTRTGGAAIDVEGDVIELVFTGSIPVDTAAFGTRGLAPDPLAGESTGRYWDDAAYAYTDNWTMSATGPTWGMRNDVPPIDPTPLIILNELMFYPTAGDGYYIVIPNYNSFGVDVTGWQLVCDNALTFTGTLTGNMIYIFRYDDLGGALHDFFDNMTATRDNVYLYNDDGELQDMVGWHTPHLQGMSVRRVPDGFGTYDGYNDTSSEAAGWVFNTPLEVYLTEISDSESGTAQIEVYNSWYPTINFTLGGYSIENKSGAIAGGWAVEEADAGEYAIFDVSTPNGLNFEGDEVRLLQNGILVEEIGYGQYGTVPDPLPGESVQRIRNPTTGRYEDVWERNYTTGPNFGAQNNVPVDNLTSGIILNEVLFNPLVPADAFVELFNRGGARINISGWKIVCDSVYEIPPGTELDLDERYFYLFQGMDMDFFDPLNFSTAGDNIYLYTDNGSLVDMVGWSGLHTIGDSMTRVPNGNGTRDGYEDVSSYLAGWRFDMAPTVRLITIENEAKRSTIQYGHYKSYVIYNLTITNYQSINDTLEILGSTQEGYGVEIFDEMETVKISEVFLNPDGSVNITVNISLPNTIPLAIMDNITILIRSTNSSIIGDSIILNVRVYPFLNLTKSISPTQIYMNGTGHDEVATITLNMTGLGAQVAVRRYIDAVFCIDSSGSMGPPWNNDPDDLRISESQNFVSNHFEGLDRAAVVDFDDTVDLLRAPGGPQNPPMSPDYPWPQNDPQDHLSSDWQQILTNFDDINSEGGTVLWLGLNVSNQELVYHGDPTHVPIIILLTDASQLNQPPYDVPPTDIERSRREANISASYGFIIFTIGLNMINGSPEEQLLQEIASITGGQYYPAPTANDFASIYENISKYLTDLAVWDPFPSDPNPLMRDVLPFYMRLAGDGNFSVWPDKINQSGPGGTTIIDWNLEWVKLGQTVSVTFDVVSNAPGYLPANEYYLSRANYTRWDNSTETVYFPWTNITVLPPSPMPPTLYIDSWPTADDIKLYWDPPIVPGTEYYLLYRSETPMGFDFASPWKNTLVDSDPLDPGPAPPPVPKRLSFNDTGASDPTDLVNYRQQYYYCIRGVNADGEYSYSSRTVGKWTKEYPAGNATFSLPLEPLVQQNTEDYAQAMNARFIKWMDPGTHFWVQHDLGDPGNNTMVEVGKGYEVDFASASRYTFLGMPGGMIRYKDDSTVGFYGAAATSLDAFPNPLTGIVTLTWDPATGMTAGVDNYYVYYTNERDGFHGLKGSDYINIGILPAGTLTVDHPVALVPGTRLYYMVIPVNETGVEGASTYSIGVWVQDIAAEYDTVGVPLILDTYDSVDVYCDIDNVVGINFLMAAEQRWGWHSRRMPAGAYDPAMAITEGFQVSTTGSTQFLFKGH
ncbi:MAG: lamin tail domain-containing protein [Thermoplasmata archaeon]|nr:MAG: lamin tail domain-containing protein [Thermoplasmata archaeon]